MSTPGTQEPNERLHALDAIRGFALLLGVVLHSTMSFQFGLIDSGWPIVNNQSSVEMDLVFYIIHVFRMSTFFFIAGFFAHLVFHRRGVRQFFIDRSKRIVLPLLLFWPLCIGTIGGVFAWAFISSGVDTSAIEAPPEAVEGAFPLTHLWFLYVLVWLYLIIVLLRGLLALLDKKESFRTTADKILAVLVSLPASALVLSLPIAFALNSIDNWAWWGGVPTPDQSLVPTPASLFIYAYVFSIGWMFDRQKPLLNVLKEQWQMNLLIGSVACALCLYLSGIRSDFAVVEDGLEKMIYAFSYGIAIVAWSFAFIGAGMRFFAEENRTIRYLADASYWVYILHFTLVIAWQTALMDVSLHWSLKFLIINLGTCVPLLITYNWWVRSTWIGKMLNGRKYTRVRFFRTSSTAPDAL